ncbi:MAG TPA: thiamine pyrophosphate-dependent enzyme, partial [Microbacterium sp.]|nr:thiamine pyrophosphate-dependent enzyme [Microbacterium sp.]
VPIADRAPGFGIPSLRVDGNDVIACTAAMRWALDRARSGQGPAFIEAVTYRMGPHTTSDDPTRYRDKDELERWRGRDPLQRVETHLRRIGAFDDAFAEEVARAGDAFATAMRDAVLTATTRPAIEVLDDVYAEPHSGITRQRERFAAYLDGFADGEA